MKFYDALTTSDSLTANGRETHSTSGSFVLDFFGAMGSSRGQDLSGLFLRAYGEDRDLALRCLQFLRDPRGGMGERDQFRNCLRALARVNPADATAIANKIPNVGRWDDMKALLGTEVQNHAVTMWGHALTVDADGLAAKWMPRKGEVFNLVRKYFDLKPKHLRKILVGLTNVVETKMCNREWSDIVYSKLPSRAQLIYRKAFARNDGQRYEDYLSALESGEAKVNSAVLFPHEILHSVATFGWYGEYSPSKLAEAQWKGLPDYLEGKGSILPIVDVSSSMDCNLHGSSATCMQVSIALGMYLAERCDAAFKDHFITFSDKPSLQKLVGSTLVERANNLKRADWAGSTNIDAAFRLILDQAVKHNVPQEAMPSKVLILSDMEFNGNYSRNTPVSAGLRSKFKAAGYTMPQVVFWNLHARPGNVPIKTHASGMALVSGYSPAIMKSILSGKSYEPLDLVREAVCIDKYDY